MKQKIQIIDDVENIECDLKLKITTTNFNKSNPHDETPEKNLIIKYIPCGKLSEIEVSGDNKIECPICKSEYFNINWKIIRSQRIISMREIRKTGVEPSQIKYINTIMKCGVCNSEFQLNNISLVKKISSSFIHHTEPKKMSGFDYIKNILCLFVCP